MTRLLHGVAANPSTPEPLLLRLSGRPELAHALLSRLLVCERHGDVVPPEALAEAATTRRRRSSSACSAASNPALSAGELERISASASGGPS